MAKAEVAGYRLAKYCFKIQDKVIFCVSTTRHKFFTITRPFQVTFSTSFFASRRQFTHDNVIVKIIVKIKILVDQKCRPRLLRKHVERDHDDC